MQKKQYKVKRTNFIIPLIVYPFDVMFSIGESNEKLRRTLKDRLTPAAYAVATEDDFIFGSIEGQNAHTMFITGHCQTVVRMGCEASRGTVAHEIFHAVSIMMRHIQMPLCAENDEAYAYLIGYLTEQFWKEIKK